MASCDSFTVEIREELTTVIQNVRARIQDSNGSFNGNTNSGTFSGNTPVGRIKGMYTVNSDTATITITDRPIMAPCGKIQSKIREYFG